MSDSKQFWKSKTFWASVITVVVPYFPPAAVFIAAHPEVITTVLGLIFGALRVTTTAPVKLK